MGKGEKEALNSRARDRQKDKIKTIRERGKGQARKAEPKESSSKREGCNRKKLRRVPREARKGGESREKEKATGNMIPALKTTPQMGETFLKIRRSSCTQMPASV